MDSAFRSKFVIHGANIYSIKNWCGEAVSPWSTISSHFIVDQSNIIINQSFLWSGIPFLLYVFVCALWSIFAFLASARYLQTVYSLIFSFFLEHQKVVLKILVDSNWYQTYCQLKWEKKWSLKNNFYVIISFENDFNEKK